MSRLRTILGTMQLRNAFMQLNNSATVNRRYFHYEEPTKPFDNLPIKVKSRYTLSVTFAVLYGIGLWAPFFILWYSMAKRTM